MANGKTVKRTHALLVLGGLSMASYDISANATTMANCMLQCAYVTASVSQACAGRPVNVFCVWNDYVPPPCYIQVTCG